MLSQLFLYVVVQWFNSFLRVRVCVCARLATWIFLLHLWCVVCIFML